MSLHYLFTMLLHCTALPVPCESKSFAVIRYCMGEIIYAEHPKGCSLQLFYRTSPCKERGSARSGWEQVVYRHNFLCGRVYLPEHPEGVPYSSSIYSFL